MEPVRRRGARGRASFGRWVALTMVAVGLALVVGVLAVADNRPRLPPATGPAGNGTLALAESSGLWLADPGSWTIRRGAELAWSKSPLFSSDGTRLAAIDGNDVAVAAADGTGPRYINSGLGLLGMIGGWSPDGRFVVVAGDLDGYPSIAVVPVDGAPVRVLDVGMAADEPAWQPEGSLILFRGFAGSGHVALWTVPADGSSAPVAIVKNGFGDVGAERDPIDPAADWSPDGRFVAYRALDADPAVYLHVVSADGSGDHILVPQPGSAAGPPRWSPDGRSLLTWYDALEGVDEGPRRILLNVPVDGSPALRIRATTTFGDWSASSGDFGSAAGPDWSPDGRFVAGRFWTGVDGGLETSGVIDVRTGVAQWLPGSADAFSWQRVAP